MAESAVVNDNVTTKESTELTQEDREAFRKLMADNYAKSVEKKPKKEARKQARKEENERILAEYRASKAAKKAAKLGDDAPVEEAGAEKMDDDDELIEIIDGSEVEIIDGEKIYKPNFIRKTVTEDDKVVPFSFGGKYIQDETENNVSEATSTIQDASTVSRPGFSYVETHDIKDLILRDVTIKEMFPGIDRNNIELRDGLILMHIERDNDMVETYRVDLNGDQVYVQAPMNKPLFNLETNEAYMFVSVPTSSDVGIKILSNENYIVDSNEVDTTSGKTVLRDNEKAM